MCARASICPLMRDPQKRAAADKITSAIAPGFPKGLAKPALRALAHAGVKELGDLRQRSEANLSELHGIGPSGMNVLRAAMRERGWKFLPER